MINEIIYFRIFEKRTLIEVMIIKVAMKFLLIFLILLIHYNVSLCQSQIDSLSKIKNTTLFSHSSISFSIVPYVVNKAKVIPISGKYHLRTPYMNGAEAGIEHYSNFRKNFSLIIGFHAGAASRNYDLHISKFDFTPNLEFDVQEYGAPTREWDFYIDLPIWIEKRWFTKNNSFWNLLTGVNVHYYPIRYYVDELGAEYPDVDGNYIDVLELNCSIGNNLLPWLNYNIGGGYSLLLQNNNYLKCNLLVNFSSKKMVNGTYQINVTGKPESTGKYSANLAYVGLSFSYIFTGANKRLRKIYEEKLKAKN
ncbi:MAG TPA: hypothetical protein VN722_13330 [Hanamia sp.]|nr:hypothetical protein [Hanamia sp.]